MEPAWEFFAWAGNTYMFLFASAAFGPLRRPKVPFYDEYSKRSPWLISRPHYFWLWLLLYAPLTQAVYFVWKNGGWEKNFVSLSLYFLTLFFHFIWSSCMFWWRSYTSAITFGILGFLISIITTVLFGLAEGISALLFCPMVAWFLIACIIAFTIYTFNSRDHQPSRRYGYKV